MALWSKVDVSGTDGGLERSRHALSESKELSSMSSMLNTEKVSNGSPAPAASDLLLGQGARFEGKLTFQGTLRMDAVFIGTIVTKDILIIGEAGRIDADITCGTIIIHGDVNGKVQATNAVEIHRTAKVRGDVETASLVVEKGALFQGSCKMERTTTVAGKTGVQVV
jgi:cytoskeletal protein CcmA (bactofilin family)